LKAINKNNIFQPELQSNASAKLYPSLKGDALWKCEHWYKRSMLMGV